MEKEKNSASGAKVLEPKKEKRRRLVLSSDSETEGFVISARGKADEAAGGSRNVAEEKGGVGEKAATRQEFLERRLGTKGGKENLSEMGSDSKSREAGDAHVIRKKIKSYSLGSDGYLSEKAGAVKVFEVGSDRKSMATWDAGARIKKAKSEHVVNQLEKTEGNGKKLDSLKQRSSIMKGFTDGIQGLNVPATASKKTDMDSPVERKLHFNHNKCGKTETEHSRWLEQLGERGHQKLMDNRVPGVGSKKEENDGSSQHGYIRMQGKNGVLKVLQKNKVHAPGNAIDRGQVEGYTRRLKSSNTEKISKSNDEVERWGADNSRSTGKVSAEGRSEGHGTKSKPEKLSGNSSAVHLLHGKTSAKAKKRERVSGLRSPPLVKSATKESRASRNEVKKKLREQIKNILLDAGWKIELRPRKGRDYEDAVYVSPQGTGYWSITKAYDVYREHLNSDSDDNKGSTIQSKPSVGADSNHEGPSSTLAEIDPEALNLLKRNVVNKRKRKKEAVKLKHKVGSRRSKKSMETAQVKCSKDETSGDVGGTRVIKKQSNNLPVDGSSIKKMHLIVRNKKGTGCVLLVRGSKHGKETEKSDYSPYVWKRTVLSWMIDMGVLPAYGKVRYMNKSKNRTLLEGRITRDGIHCSCCSKILTVSKFEIHAGSKMHQPYENALVEVSGVSLLQCQINAWEKQEQHKRRGFYEIDIDGDDQNDDTCSICGDGGDLICCDGCPSTFHLSCLGIQVLPPGDWHCANCSCKFCGILHNSASPCKGATTPLLTCSQCEQKYHEECVPEGDAVFNAPNNQFCGRGCRKVFRQLQKLIGVKNELEAGYSWSIIRRFSDPSQSPSRFAQRVESNSKIAVAHAVMDECFLPIIDHRSGINLIDNVVYNCRSNFNRLNFSGFYTFILERNDEIISVASVRIHGTRLGEMPFIGTRSMYRRQGMCRRLLEGIESALCSFSTEILIIPAISELTDTWTTVFGFRPLEISQKEEIKCVNMWVFPGTGLLHKQLLKKDSTAQNMLPQEAAKRKSKLIHHEVIGGSIPEAQLPIEADPMGSAAEIFCTQESAKHEEEGTEDTTKGSAVKVISCKELKPEEEGAEYKIPALPPSNIDLLPDASQVFIASMAKDNLAERDPIADPQTQLQLFDDDLNSSNPCIDTDAKFVTKTVESHADAGEEAVAPVANKVKSGHAADELEINVSEANAEVSVGIENLNASSEESSKVSLVAKQNGFEACVSGIGAMADVHDKQDCTIIQPFPAAEHCHCDDKCVLEISHDSNSFPCSSEQNACDPIDHTTQYQNSESPDKSSHTDHESCNYSSPAVITNEKPQIDAVSCLVLEPDDNLLHAMANKLVPQGSFTVSGSVISLHGGSATGFVSINSTTEVSTNKIMISKAGVNQAVALATCEVGDDICAEIDNYHEGPCDVRIAEENLDVVESVQAFDLSSVNQTSKIIT